jgi:dipeptidyl aminopeptidase/acylaminoacyl peptidase
MRVGRFSLATLGFLTLFFIGCSQREHGGAGATTAAAPRSKSSAAAQKSSGDLIAREVLFGNPDRAGPQTSADGKRLAFLAPSNGVLNVWVAPIDNPGAAQVVTKDTNRGIRRYFWAYNNQHIIYMQDKGGDENWRVYSVDLANNNAEKDLTPFDKVNARIEEVSHKFPDEIVVGLNNRDAKYHDQHRVNIRTGQMTLLAQNNDGFTGFLTDDDYKVRFASKMTPDGGSEVLKAADGGQWSPYLKIEMEDNMTTGPRGFDKAGKSLYFVDSRGRNTAALTTFDIETKKQTTIGEDAKADIGGLLIHPTEKNIQAYSANYLRNEWRVVDKSIQGDFDYLKGVTDGEFIVGSRSLDDKKWIVTYVLDNGPVRYYVYDRPTKKATFLFTNNQDLERATLAKMTPVIIKSRDGMDLISYLTLPPSERVSGSTPRPSRPLPMVLNVHGGPWGRDVWGYNPTHQWLANRGYAVLSVNFRGSTGFGKNFINASNLEWAGKMHDDLIDAVNWAKKEKIADPNRIAIMGGSYGGYATLVGLTFTPDVFACGVDIVGPSNIVTLLNTIPPYWAPMVEMWKHRVGDHQTEEGKSFLNQRSPLTFVDRIKKPLLIGQGANDPRVKQSESDQIVKAMQDKRIPVTYVVFPDEGHGFARPENRMSFNAVAEAFLAQHLGGRFEPIGSDFTGASITVPTGAEGVPGVAEALGAAPKTRG